MNHCVVGLQWGDEGKGKIVDILAEQSDIVVRYSGGANAGHTVIIGDDRFALHLLPSGVLRPNVKCVITNAVALDPEVVTTEIQELTARGFTLTERLFISENAHLVLDYHKTEDRLREESLGKNKIGTTIRGIGPCYADKVQRSYAIRMGDLRDLQKLRTKLHAVAEYKSKLFQVLYNAEAVDAEAVFEKCKSHAERLLPFATDTTEMLHKYIGEGKTILFEGAQGTLLDIDHGTFPFVTSSNSSALGMPAGSGVPAKLVDKFIGVVKAYSTRVGAGPFPTEQDNEIGGYIRENGNEYGTTTGRPRRCGWFDAVAVRYAAQIGAVDSIALMHLDTLAGLQELKICREYQIGQEQTAFFPANLDKLAQVQCVYETMPGWDDDITGIDDFNDLPLKAQHFVCRVEEMTKKPVTIIGVGPKRSQTIFR